MFRSNGKDPERIILKVDWYAMIVCPYCRNNPPTHCLECDEVGSLGFRTPLCPTDLDVPWTINEKHYQILLEEKVEEEDSTEKGFFNWLINLI